MTSIGIFIYDIFKNSFISMILEIPESMIIELINALIEQYLMQNFSQCVQFNIQDYTHYTTQLVVVKSRFSRWLKLILMRYLQFLVVNNTVLPWNTSERNNQFHLICRELKKCVPGTKDKLQKGNPN